MRPIHRATIRFIEDAVLPGENFLIAGGFARDLFYGDPPKDIDFWVEHRADAFTDTAQRVHERLTECGVPFEVHLQYDSEDHDTRNRLAVFTVSMGVDIIVSDEPPIESVKNFDFNLNQFVLKGEKPYFVGTTHPEDGLVKTTEGPLSMDRVLRMQRKWRRLCGRPE